MKEDYETSLAKMLLPKAPVRRELSTFLRRTMKCQSGSCVSIFLLDEVSLSFKVCRIESKGEYALPPHRTLSIVPSDDVDISYFITCLFDPEGAMYPLMAVASMVCATDRGILIQRGYLENILSTRPVRVVLDRRKQGEIVRSIVQGELVIGETDARYGIAMAGSPLSDEEKACLPVWGINVISETERVAGPGGLDEILKADSEKPVRRIDAVFFDVNVGSTGAAVRYDGLFNAMKTVGEDIPLLIISDVSMESFGTVEKYMFDCLKRENHIFVFKEDGNALRIAVRDLRDRLDTKRSPDRGVKMKYSEELELAESLDPSGDLAINLVKAMRGEFEDSEDPKEIADRIGLLRIGAETIFNDAKERALLPPLTFLGAMQQFLADGEYFDNGSRRYYKLTEDVMPTTLSCAFEYFVTIVNGGHHAKQKGKLDVIGYISSVAKSPNVYRSCVFILMDLLRWYGGLNTNSPLYEEASPFLEDDVIRKVKDGNRDYYYIGRVHLGYSQGLTEGIPGRVLSLRNVSLEKYPVPPGVENEIRFFSTDYKIGR